RGVLPTPLARRAVSRPPDPGRGRRPPARLPRPGASPRGQHHRLEGGRPGGDHPRPCRAHARGTNPGAGPERGVSRRLGSHVSEGVFQQMVDRGELAEWARVHGHLYGTAVQTLETVLDRGQDILLDIDTQGARQLRGRYPLGLYVFVVAPSLKELEQRLKERK